MTTSAMKCRAAVITPPGEGGIGVIRLTGRDAPALVQEFFRGKRPAHLLAEGAGRKLHYGHLVKDDEVLDEVLVTVTRPGAEDPAVEINCHGGIVAVERVMVELERRGAERVPADVAVDSQLDAAQREAAVAIPRALSRQAVRMLLEQYNGALSRAVCNAGQMAPRAAVDALVRIEATARLGMAFCRPSRVVIVGAPNAGKSTLFNALVGHSRAIVTHIPGTTRDFISDVVVIAGLPFELIDTAGLRKTDHVVEREGVRVSHEQISSADIVVLVFDATLEPGDEQEQMRTQRAMPGAWTIVAANKMDLLGGGVPSFAGDADICISAATGAGLADLEARIVGAAVGSESCSGGAAVFTQRQLHLISSALEAARRGDEAFREILHAVVDPTEA
jgi:tRNA modification GTPase